MGGQKLSCTCSIDPRCFSPDFMANIWLLNSVLHSMDARIKSRSEAALELQAIQSQWVADHGNRAERHGGAGDDRAQKNTKERIQSTRGDGNSQYIVDECKKQILPDVPHGRATYAARFRDAAQIALYQGNVRALDGDIGACAHSDTDLSLRQRRSVIDAVAGHGDDPPFGLKAFDHFNFLFGRYFGFHSIDTQAARHGLSRGPAVARQHDDPNTLSMQNFDRFLGRLLDWIGNRHESSHTAIDCDEHHRAHLDAILRHARARVRD